ncbi:MAG: signal peptidase I [Acidobacteria bacterium]|nr:signal peptidase I [Acidobacteriota bacterium]
MSRQRKAHSRKKKRQQEEDQPSALREYFLTIVVCTIIALFVTTYVVHPMSVPTPSMEPTILVGDRLLIDKFTIRNGYESGLPAVPIYTVQRQDIVVCKALLEPEILLVKRVIGIPGDRLEIRNKVVYINGEALDEPYKRHSDPNIVVGNGGRDNYSAIIIPEDSYFVMGDNRDDSYDSRSWGFLPKRYLVGRPLFIFWSYQDPPDAHLRTSLVEILELYGQRLLFFVTRTRWNRMGKVLR